MRLMLVLFAAALGGCAEGSSPLLGGDAEHGKLLLRQFGCGHCHVIPGVPTADGLVGPPLEGIAKRVYLAGVLPNTRENMAAFIREPTLAHPQTLMPDLGVSEAHARDMTAYLYTLK